MTTTNVRLSDQGRRSWMNKALAQLDEEPLQGDERAIASVVFAARSDEVRVSLGAMVFASLALLVALFALTNLSPFILLMVFATNAAAVWVTFGLYERAGRTAALQAVVEHRQSVKLANLTHVAGPNGTAPRAARTVLVGAAAALACAAMLATSLHTRR